MNIDFFEKVGMTEEEKNIFNRIFILVKQSTRDEELDLQKEIEKIVEVSFNDN